MASGINIGVRYVLPALPFLFIMSGAFLDWLLTRYANRRAVLALAVGLLCLMGVETVRAYPDYMTYMNQLASRAPHWWYLSDSNVEWGDDCREMALYLRERGEKRIGAALLNWQVMDRYDIELVTIFVPPGRQPEETRYVAIGASYLNGSIVPDKVDGIELSEAQRTGYFDEYRRRTPEKIFGNSIYLYRLKE
ncbi:MAG: hypothetical protein LC754_12770 [Acidobacteria bacterium]|nr:hypothetical protein [Acidobacteriota bacterium]